MTNPCFRGLPPSKGPALLCWAFDMLLEKPWGWGLIEQVGQWLSEQPTYLILWQRAAFLRQSQSSPNFSLFRLTPGATWQTRKWLFLKFQRRAKAASW